MRVSSIWWWIGKWPLGNLARPTSFQIIWWHPPTTHTCKSKAATMQRSKNSQEIQHHLYDLLQEQQIFQKVINLQSSTTGMLLMSQQRKYEALDKEITKEKLTAEHKCQKNQSGPDGHQSYLRQYNCTLLEGTRKMETRWESWQGDIKMTLNQRRS